MKKLKLTSVQKYLIGDAYQNTSRILREIKASTLTGDALAKMKVLEAAVQNLEIIQSLE